jgi:ABC-2 type transport system permease protein
MINIALIMRRELGGYFYSPLAYVFIVIFAAVTGAFAFYLGNFFALGQADLQPFFTYHPWLYLMLAPAIAMRLWAEERKSGTIELLMTLPISTTQAVVGKFLAAWVFCGVALVATTPLWITVNVLGVPDNGVILASYLASFLMAGAFLAIGSAISATTSNQVIAFVVSAAICFVVMLSSLDIVLDLFRGWAPQLIIDTIASISFLNHFLGITRGVIALGDLVFFASMISMWLFINVIVVDLKKGT